MTSHFISVAVITIRAASSTAALHEVFDRYYGLSTTDVMLSHLTPERVRSCVHPVHTWPKKIGGRWDR